MPLTTPQLHDMYIKAATELASISNLSHLAFHLVQAPTVVSPALRPLPILYGMSAVSGSKFEVQPAELLDFARLVHTLLVSVQRYSGTLPTAEVITLPAMLRGDYGNPDDPDDEDERPSARRVLDIPLSQVRAPVGGDSVALAKVLCRMLWAVSWEIEKGMRSMADSTTEVVATLTDLNLFILRQ